MADYPHTERNRLFCRAAEALYGKRWGRRLAAEINTPQATIAAIATGRRAVTPELEVRLGALIGLEIRGWQERTQVLTPIAVELLGKHKEIEE